MGKKILDKYIIEENGSVFNFQKDKPASIRFHKNRYEVDHYYQLHKLLALAFIKDYEPQTDHILFKDKDPKNCCLSNLEIKKNGRITKKPDDQTAMFFESQDPYRIIKGYLAKRSIFSDSYFTTSCFTYDDLIQYMAMFLYRRTVQYMIKQKDKMSYVHFAFNIFDFMFQSGDVHRLINKYRSSFEITNTFDYEIDPAYHFVSSKEYLDTSYENHNISTKFITGKV